MEKTYLVERLITASDILEKYGFYEESDLIDECVSNYSLNKIVISANINTNPKANQKTPQYMHYIEKIESPLTNLDELLKFINKDTNLLPNEKQELSKKVKFEKFLNPTKFENSVASGFQSIPEGAIAGLDAAIVGSETKNLSKQAKQLLAKAKQNPQLVQAAETMVEKVGTKIPSLSKIFSHSIGVLALAGVFMQRKQLYNYALRINKGEFNEIWNDPAERADFIEIFANAISAFTMFFPILAPITSILFAVSSGISLGKYGYEKWRDLSGNKAKEEMDQSVVDYFSDSLGSTLSNSMIEVRYIFNKYIKFALRNAYINKTPIKLVNLLNLPQVLNDKLVGDKMRNITSPENKLFYTQYYTLLTQAVNVTNNMIKPKRAR